jgi:hypothetical protein
MDALINFVSFCVLLQFSGPPCGQHGAYTFYKSFKYSIQNKVRSLSLGEFFYLRVLEDAPVCIGELQLLWVDKNQSEYQLCSVRLYFAPENTPEGRLPHHGKVRDVIKILLHIFPSSIFNHFKIKPTLQKHYVNIFKAPSII